MLQFSVISHIIMYFLTEQRDSTMLCLDDCADYSLGRKNKKYTSEKKIKQTRKELDRCSADCFVDDQGEDSPYARSLGTDGAEAAVKCTSKCNKDAQKNLEKGIDKAENLDSDTKKRDKCYAECDGVDDEDKCKEKCDSKQEKADEKAEEKEIDKAYDKAEDKLMSCNSKCLSAAAFLFSVDAEMA